MTFKTIALAIAGTAVLGVGIATAGITTGFGGSPVGALSLADGTTDGPTTGTATEVPALQAGTSGAVITSEDVSGPCDEAEHAGDPACQGAATVGSDPPDDEADDDVRSGGATTEDDRDDGGRSEHDDTGDDRSGSESRDDHGESDDHGGDHGGASHGSSGSSRDSDDGGHGD